MIATTVDTRLATGMCACTIVPTGTHRRHLAERADTRVIKVTIERATEAGLYPERRRVLSDAPKFRTRRTRRLRM